MIREMRRQERKISTEEAIELLKKCQYGILSTVGEDGFPYGVPLNYVYLNDRIYFQCAPEGHKLDNIKFSDKVSFCVVGDVEAVPEKLTTKYESAVVFGKAYEVSGEEKHAALVGLIEKYSSSYMEKGMKCVQNAGDKLKVIGITVDRITGKANR